MRIAYVYMHNFNDMLPLFYRYNISTDDYDGWKTNSSYNNE